MGVTEGQARAMHLLLEEDLPRRQLPLQDIPDTRQPQVDPLHLQTDTVSVILIFILSIVLGSPRHIFLSRGF